MKKHSLFVCGTAALAVLLALRSCAWLDDGAGFSRSRLETGPAAGGDRGNAGGPSIVKEGSLMVTAVE